MHPISHPARSIFHALFAGSLACAACLCAHDARAQVSDPIQYVLAPTSAMEYGCFGPCACPVVVSGAMNGTFTFYRTSVDPQYSHYALVNIDWKYTPRDTSSSLVVHVTGHGTYDLGGEVAVMQRMTLDLTIDDPRRPPFEQHYDSGLVPTRATFPAIDVESHLHVDACHDSVVHVVAKPTGFTAVASAGDRPLLRVAAPNPTTAGIDITFAPASPAVVRIDVVDVRGRVVRRLVDGRVAAGEQRAHWDGRDARGADAGVGLFWIVARSGARSDRLRVARLR